MELLILCIALYCYLWRPPLYTHNVEVLFFFLPYYFTAALPTSVALFWKRTKADPVSQSVSQWVGGCRGLDLGGLVGIC